MIGDHYTEKFQPYTTNITTTTFELAITRAEFEALRKDVLEMKDLLKRAIAYDKMKGEPDCQQEAKIATLRAIAKAVGIDASDVLGPEPTP